MGAFQAKAQEKRIERYPIGTKLPLKTAINLLDKRIAHERNQLKKLENQYDKLMRKIADKVRIWDTNELAQRYFRLNSNMLELKDKYQNYIDKLEIALGELKAQQMTDKTIRIITWELPARTTVLTTNSINQNPHLARLAKPQETVIKVQ